MSKDPVHKQFLRDQAAFGQRNAEIAREKEGQPVPFKWERPISRARLEAFFLRLRAAQESASAHYAQYVTECRKLTTAYVEMHRELNIPSGFQIQLSLERLVKMQADEQARMGALAPTENMTNRPRGIVSIPGTHADEYRMDYINRPDQIPPFDERLAEMLEIVRKVNNGEANG